MHTSGEPLDRALSRVLEAYPEVVAAWLFGSVARGEARPDSDLDLGIVLRRRGDTALDHHRRLRALAADLETVSEGRTIDLVVLESQGPIFCHRVLSEGRLVHDADRERRIDFESDTHVRYFDFLPTWRIAAGVALDGFRDWLQARR